MNSKANKKVLFIAQAAIIAALYAALTYAQNLLLPGTTSMAVQFRLSEALTLLCVFTPAAIPGLTIGCIAANLMNVSVLPLDMILGSLATLLAAIAMYLLRNVCVKNLPLLAALMPAIFNGIIVGLEIEIFFIDGPFNFVSFLIQAGCVFLGEFAVCMTVGLLLVVVIKKRGLDKKLMLK
ncbi:MAG: QueT transporter family protein [Acutalibacteraceae bacterium]